jgi:hypothetical protein
MSDGVGDLSAGLQLGPKQSGVGLVRKGPGSGASFKSAGVASQSFARVDLSKTGGGAANGSRRSSQNYRSRFQAPSPAFDADETIITDQHPDGGPVSPATSPVQEEGEGDFTQDFTKQTDSFGESPEFALSAQQVANREQLRNAHEQTQLELMKLLDKIREDPESNQFHYLMRFPVDDFPTNPYHLKVVPHAQVDEDHFFTLSASGVTQFDKGKADFTQLDQWQREYYLFNEILQIKCFKSYLYWKIWKCWRKFVRNTKVRSSPPPGHHICIGVRISPRSPYNRRTMITAVGVLRLREAARARRCPPRRSRSRSTCSRSTRRSRSPSSTSARTAATSSTATTASSSSRWRTRRSTSSATSWPPRRGRRRSAPRQHYTPPLLLYGGCMGQPCLPKIWG